MTVTDCKVAEGVEQVRAEAMRSMRSSSLRRLVEQFRPWLASGKMLRARLTLHLGCATGMPARDAVRAAAAVELMHAASLLHDDVIDEGRIRRGQPTLWVQQGVKSAVLVGDLMVCQAFALAQRCRRASLASLLVESAREMCDAEAEQELILKGRTADWETCVSVARRKTGSLFAFAACAAAGGGDPLRTALREAGYLLGTAYQLADDVFDAHGDGQYADKTLGTDAARGKPTAATAAAAQGVDPRRYVWRLCDAAAAMLAGWPDVRDAWEGYMTSEARPVLEGFFEPAGTDALS